MSSAWERCRGANPSVAAPLDVVDAVYVWAAGEAAVGARAAAALLADQLDLPLLVGSGPHVPAWVGGGTLAVLVDRAGESLGGALLGELLDRGCPLVGLTADRGLAELLDAGDHVVLDMPAEDAVLPPVVVPLLEVFGADGAVEALAGWQAPAAWGEDDALPLALARAAAGAAVPGVYGSDGVGAVAAEWFAAQLRLFTSGPAVGASFSDALTHLPAWEGAGGLTPIAWLVADDAQAGVPVAFDRVAGGATTVRCAERTPAGRLAELVGLAEMAVSALAR